MSMQISTASYLSYYLEEVEHVIVQLQIYIPNSRMPQEPIFKCQQTMAFLTYTLSVLVSYMVSFKKLILLLPLYKPFAKYHAHFKPFNIYDILYLNIYRL